MRGIIIQFDPIQKSGMISGNDDNRYSFTAKDIAKNQKLAANIKVDFTIIDGQATDIYSIDSKGLLYVSAPQCLQ